MWGDKHGTMNTADTLRSGAVAFIVGVAIYIAWDVRTFVAANTYSQERVARLTWGVAACAAISVARLLWVKAMRPLGK